MEPCVVQHTKLRFLALLTLFFVRIFFSVIKLDLRYIKIALLTVVDSTHPVQVYRIKVSFLSKYISWFSDTLNKWDTWEIDMATKSFPVSVPV